MWVNRRKRQGRDQEKNWWNGKKVRWEYKEGRWYWRKDGDNKGTLK